MRLRLPAIFFTVLASCAPAVEKSYPSPTPPPVDDSPHARAVVSLRVGDRGTDVAVAPDGGIAITGSVGSYSELVGGPVGSTDAFVARFDKDGRKVWAKRMGGTSTDYGLSVAVDLEGNVIALGTMMGLVDLGGGPIGTDVGQGFYLVKYDTSGVHQWSRALPMGERVGLDRAGNVVVAGTFERTVDLGAGPVTSAGGRDVLLATLSPDGKLLSTRALGDASDETLRALSVDLLGRVAVARTTSSSTVSTATIDVIEGGKIAWTRRLSAKTFQPRAMGFDGSGALTLSASFAGMLELEGIATLRADQDRTLLLRLGRDGEHVWHRALGMEGTQTHGVISVEPDGALTMMGAFRGTLDLGDRVVRTSADGAFVARFSPSGETLWSRVHGANARVDTHAIAADGTGYAWALGEHADPIDFGGGTLLPSLPSSAFLVKLSP